MNMQIILFKYHMKGQCPSFYLVPTLSVYDEHKLRYGYFSMYTVVIQYVSRVAMERVKFHLAQNSFFLTICFSHLVSRSEQFGIHEKLSLGAK